MLKKREYKVGDKIVNFGQVYRIFKIEDQGKGVNGRERIIHYRPYFKSKDNRTVVCSIPVSSLDKTSIRKPISKSEVKEIMQNLSVKLYRREHVETEEAKELINKNKPGVTMRVLKRLWKEKESEPEGFTKSKKDVLELAVKRLAEEVAYVSNISIEKANARINSALQSAYV